MTKPGRNDSCPCGSGKKYKHCCERKNQAPMAKTSTQTAFIAGALQSAIAQHQSGHIPQAKALYQQILQADPNQPDALHLLGLIEHQQGDSARGLALMQQAIQARPNDASFHFNLGNLYQDLGQLDAAIASFGQALRLQPSFVDALLGLGTAFKAQSRHDDAIESYQRVLAIQPDCVAAHFNLGNALMAQNQFDTALISFHNAVRLKPHDMGASENLLFTLQNLTTITPDEVFHEHLDYAERFEAPIKPYWQPHCNSREPERRLKVGYVSGDFRQHVVAYFIEPILANHDKAVVELFGYANNTVHDAYTDRIAAHMDHWLMCKSMSDDQLADRIRADGVDILVDLSGHTSDNRLPVFARKPAPVQATYIGYPDTTGLSAMDYRISDAWLDPPGLTERYHSETLVRIPGGMAFRPDPDAPDVNALPALTSGELILASFNHLRKVNSAVIQLWARILHTLPQARLMLGNVSGSETAQRLTSQFEQRGIAPERLILMPSMTLTDYHLIHHKIDLALDPFPYNGTTTTMQTLWMGVPVITLAGNNAKSRCGVSLMSRVGLPEFIAQSEDEYVHCAVKFANDLPKLNEVRQSLRARMNAPACQPAAITRQLEAAYRDMWRTWCAQNPQLHP